ncbi:MAG: hypothetical protein M3Z23_19470 [Acidobacteriota bacterium]|nr:hypothetical protein [Acidobacteriota bacterium]
MTSGITPKPAEPGWIQSKILLVEHKFSLALAAILFAIGPASAQLDTAAWKRVKVFKDNKAIVNVVDVDPSWKRLLFKWSCPCDADRMLLLTSRGFERTAHPLARKQIAIDPEGEVTFDVPDGAATLTISMYGKHCGSSMEVEVLAPIFPAGAETTFDFRKTKWGMAKEKVIAGEGSPTSETSGRLVYVLQVAGLKSALNYDFEDGRLAKAEYVLLENYSEPSQYVVAGAVWLDALKERYGESKQETRWLSNAYRADESKYATAIAAGDLVVKNMWQTERTRITHAITGSNGEISVRITYIGRQAQSHSRDSVVTLSRQDDPASPR